LLQPCTTHFNTGMEMHAYINTATASLLLPHLFEQYTGCNHRHGTTHTCLQTFMYTNIRM
jgi:hypothetical protein